MADWFHGRFTRLGQNNNEQEKKDILAEVRIKLGNLTNEDLRHVAQNVDLNVVFTQLTSTDSEIIEQTCDIVGVLMNALEPLEVHQRYPTAMASFVSHQEPAVKYLGLKELLRVTNESAQVQMLLRDVNLLVAVAERVGDESLSVAKTAGAVLKKIGEHSAGLRVLYSGQLLRTLARLIAKNDVVSYRVHEIIVDISIASKEGLEASEKSGFLSRLIAELSNDDILLQLNALETITGLALTLHGLDYLERQEILQKLADKVAYANENPLSTLLIPGLMKFFGNVGQCRPNEIFSRYPVVVSALFEVIDSGDLTILPVALDTLGHISTRVEGKYALENLGDAMLGALKKVSEVIQKMPTELKIRGLNNLTLILKVQKAEQDNRIVSLTKSWFDVLADDPLGLIVSFAKQPFADIRLASFEVLATIASQVWGQEYIANCPGLTEFLLNRNIESFKECKEAKYDIVRILSMAVPDIFDASTMQSFKQFVNEGPMYVETQTDVATEGAS